MSMNLKTKRRNSQHHKPDRADALTDGNTLRTVRSTTVCPWTAMGMVPGESRNLRGRWKGIRSEKWHKMTSSTPHTQDATLLRTRSSVLVMNLLVKASLICTTRKDEENIKPHFRIACDGEKIFYCWRYFLTALMNLQTSSLSLSSIHASTCVPVNANSHAKTK